VYAYEQADKRRLQAASETRPVVGEPLPGEEEQTPLGEVEEDYNDDDGVEEEYPQDAETEELMRQWQAQNPDFQCGLQVSSNSSLLKESFSTILKNIM